MSDQLNQTKPKIENSYVSGPYYSLDFIVEPLIFASKKQSITALSSAQAEYVAARQAAREVECLTALLEELGVSYQQLVLAIDNQSTISQIKSNKIATKSRHIRLKFHFVKQLYDEKVFDIAYVCSENQLADFLTKALPMPTLTSLTSKPQL